MQQNRFNYAIIPENVLCERVVAIKAVEVYWFHVTHVFVYVITLDSLETI